MTAETCCTFWSDLASFFYLVPIQASFTSIADVPDYIQTAIPYFILLVILEVLYGKARGYRLYTVKDTIMSLSLGLVHQMLALWAKEISYLPYIFVYNYCEPLRLEYFPTLYPWVDTNPTHSVLLFILSLLGCDLGYYFFHRYAHEYHMLWVSHSVHHSGERYNLATALRQGAWQFMNSWVFYLPLAAIGVPPAHFLRHSRLNTLYQFWIHTEVIGRLPWCLELILNTPSHHRVHHRPPGNCNYAGVLIIWDRIFGTFCNEGSLEKKADQDVDVSAVSEPVDYKRGVIYGLAKPLNSFDPVYANIQHALRLTGDSPHLFGKIVSFLKYTFRKRVDHPFRIANSPDEMFGDVLDDIAYAQQVMKVHGDSWATYLSMLWQRLWRLPQHIDEDALDSANLNNRDYQFMKGRIARENPPLTGPRLVVVLAQFLVTIVVVLAVLATCDSPNMTGRFGAPYKLALCLATTFSLQYIRMHYNAVVPREWMFT